MAGNANPPARGAAAAHAVVLHLPFACLGLVLSEDYLASVRFLPNHTPALAPRHPLAWLAVEQLQAYARSPRMVFDLPLAPPATSFQARLREALWCIPAGTTLTYAALARRLGSGPRAVAQACRANPLLLIVPCHRVVARHGLGGYGGSSAPTWLALKQRLLSHEASDA